ncbi:hypothetical protein bplSymb_SCF02404P010 [Bathymodiolus platifrons methanotrophic gill symbiont]|uniref:RHS repeat-associated core domain-containing protein n=1 Tax=Bathymodiolus platifrons methanotrophic gill symbiont TaxID=113268 RepID=UPI000B4145D9|nr:RHS repeat-associated core domain-containing protein [Bathymodiolus platifrons methanotrophic gill symbiont]GAW86333.1 hypothetical protein bplSymb_SCF02404P010 [Bathymodiolus platifrons methanotrophic gill symbiont]
MNIIYFKKHLSAKTILLLLIMINSLSSFANIEQKQYQYDLNSNITQQITAKGDQIDYTYDSLNQLIKVSTSDEDTDVEYGYDSEGRITSLKDATGTDLYQYDTLGRLTSYEQAGVAKFYYFYNELNQLTSFKDPLGNWTNYKYNLDGRLITHYDVNGYNSYEYHETTGLLLRHLRYSVTDTAGSYQLNGYTSYSYDTARRLTKVMQTGKDSEDKATTIYSYDGNGNHTKISRQIPGETESATYEYDGLNRITQVVYTGGSRDGQEESYSYDAGGNRLSKVNHNGTTSYEYSSDNRLLKTTAPQGVTNYVYDGGGNMITKTGPVNTFHYQYNSRNLLIGYQDSNNNVSYLYNGAGHRVAKTVNNVTTRYINHINFGLPQVAFETDDKYVVKRYYSYGLGRTAAYDWGALDKDKSQYYLYDRPGRNVTATEDSLGKTRNRYKYGSFGENFSSQESYSNDFRYTGEQTESDTGLIYLRARYYDPEIGRFISRDPFSGYMSVPESQNMYAYAHNNPLKFVDPSGECVETLWDAANVIYDIGKISYGYLNNNQHAVSSGYSDLGADLFALVIPGLPAGVTKVLNASKKGLTQQINPKNLIPTQTRNEISGSQVKRLTKDMKKNGFDQTKPVYVARNQNGRLEILDGHHRTEAARKAGLNKIPVRIWGE